ncbi:hypothetical protein Bhyg_12805 [Pseudolycoriella hygida]|uniref:Centromere protein C n=1 Tax=Pseudolycoriella hygida TaxID=35572 RepID=A0A9Q0MXY0_9DIPT|nr:hypothetical protein Bhyg_12805 [Pseudolycoriella hygida]
MLLMKELESSNQKEDSLELGDSWKDMPRRKKGASNKTTGLFRKTLLPNVNLYDIVINKQPKLTADYQNQNPSSEEEVQNEGIANLHLANIDSSSDDEESEFSKCERNKGLTAATGTPYVLRHLNPIHRPKIDTDQLQRKRKEVLPTENLLRTVSRIPINTPRSSRVRRDTAEGRYSKKRDISTISSQVVSSTVDNFNEAHHEPETAEQPPEELAAGLLGQNNPPTTEALNKGNCVAVRLPDKALFRVPQRRARSTRRPTIFPESVAECDQPTTSGSKFSRKNKSTKKNDVLFDSYEKVGEVIANRTSDVISDSSTSSSTRRKLYQNGDSCNEDQTSVEENRLLCENAGQDTQEFSETAERKSQNKISGHVDSTRRLYHHENASEWSDSEDEQTICAEEASTFRQAPSKNENVKNVYISPVKKDNKENTKDESKRDKMLKNSTFARVHSHSNNEESSISETVQKTKNSYTETVHLSRGKSGEHLTKMMTPNKKSIGRSSDGNSKQPPSESVDGIISDDRQNSREIEPIEEEPVNRNDERPHKQNLKQVISRNPSNEVISDDRRNSHGIEPIEEEDPHSSDKIEPIIEELLKKNVGRPSKQNAKQSISRSSSNEVISDDRQNSHGMEPIEEEPLKKNVGRHSKQHAKQSISRNTSNEVISDDRRNSHGIEPIEEEDPHSSDKIEPIIEELLKKNVGRPSKQNAKQSISRSSSNEVISDDRQNSHGMEPIEEEPLKKNVGRHSKQHAKQSISRNTSNEVISDDRRNSHGIEPIEEEDPHSSDKIEPIIEELLKKNVGRPSKQNAKQSISRSSSNEVISDDRQNSHGMEPIEEEPLKKNVGRHSKQHAKQSISRNTSNEVISDDRRNSHGIEPIEEEDPHSSDKIEPIIEEPLKKKVGRRRKQNHKQSTMEEGQKQPQEDTSRSLTNNIENPYKRRNESDADSEKVSKKKRLNAEITQNDEASKSNRTVAKRRKAKWYRTKIVTYDPSQAYEDVKGTRRSMRKRCIPEQDLSYLFPPKSTNQSASRSTRLEVQKTRKQSRNQTNTNDDTVYSILLSNKENGEEPLLTIFQGIEITQGFHTNVLKDMVIHYVPGSASPSYGYLTLEPGSSKRSRRINYELHFHVMQGPIVIISQDASEIMPTGSSAYLYSDSNFRVFRHHPSYAYFLHVC